MLCKWFRNLFCSTQTLHEQVIFEAYDVYLYALVNMQYAEDDDTRGQHYCHVQHLKQIVVEQLLLYARHYPQTRMARHGYLVNHHTRPHLLEQHFAEVLLLL